MTSGMTAFMVAVGETSLVCFLLMNRGKPARPGARVPAATPRALARVTVPAGGWGPLSWSGSDSSSSHNSALPATAAAGRGGSGGGGD